MTEYRQSFRRIVKLALPCLMRPRRWFIAVSGTTTTMTKACLQLDEQGDDMSVNVQPVTGQESFWGNLKVSPDQLKLINASPTFVGQIHDADARVQRGELKPIDVTDKVTGGYFDSLAKQIQLPLNARSDPDELLVGNVSHELGHALDDAKEWAFAGKYGVSPRDADAFNALAMRGLRAQTQGELNQWKINREVEENTATPDQRGTTLSGGYSASMRPFFDAAYEKGTAAGLNEAQMNNRLLSAGMEGIADSLDGGNPGTDYHLSGRPSGAAPIEGGDPKVTYNTDDNGDITSATQQWPSGDKSTQTFDNGKRLQSQTVDASGNPLRTSTYSYGGSDGGYGVKIVDGNGKTIQQSDFNADGSGTEVGFLQDGSRKEAQFGPTLGKGKTFGEYNKTDLITQFDPQGRQVQKDYFDPNEARDTNQVRTNQDGGKTLYSFNDQGKVGLQTDYDAQGKRVGTYAFDPDTSQVTDNTRYNQDGSRSVFTVGGDGTGSRVDIDREGNRLPPQPASFSPADQQVFQQHSSDAANVAPPQPVGSDNAFGGQKNYYDPGTNRLTNQVITNQDGSKSVYAYNDSNLVGFERNFDAEGRLTSTKHYDPNQGVDVVGMYAPDGSRVVMRPGTGVAVQEHYTPDNQLTHKTFLGGGPIDTGGGPESRTDGQKDGSNTRYSYNEYGNVGAETSYGASGQRTSSVGFDPNEGSGTVTSVNYNENGNRDVLKGDANGVRTYTVDGQGDMSNQQTRSLMPGEKENLDQWKSQAGMLDQQTQTPPQEQTVTQGSSQQENSAFSESGSLTGSATAPGAVGEPPATADTPTNADSLEQQSAATANTDDITDSSDRTEQAASSDAAE